MHLLGVFAHPDDETYSVGGCIARYSQEGIGSTILSFTRGEAGQITDGSGATRETLADVREAELRAACAIVGCDDVRIVGTPDGGTTVTDEGVGFIVRIIEELRPEVIVTMEPDGITRHPDHRAVSLMTVKAVERVVGAGMSVRLYMSAIPQSVFDEWMGHLEAAGMPHDPNDPLAPQPAPDATIACTVDIGDALGRKIDALWAHKTQSQEFIGSMPEAVVRTVLAQEAFQRAHPPFVAGDPTGDDLFEGLR